MRENFSNFIKKVVTVGALAVPVELHNPPQTPQNNNETSVESKTINTTEVDSHGIVVDTLNLPTDLEVSLQKLKAERIDFLKRQIDENIIKIQNQSNHELFDQRFNETLSHEKEDIQKYFNQLDVWQHTIDSLDQTNSTLVSDYLKLYKIDKDSTNAKEERKEIPPYSDYSLPKLEEFEGTLNTNNNYVVKNVIRDLENVVACYQQELFSVLDSIKDESDAKKITTAFFTTIKNKINEESLYNKDEKIIEAEKEDQWQKRESKEFLEMQLQNHLLELKNIEKNLSEKTLRSFVESSRKWILDNIASSAYLEKLIQEGYEPIDAQRIQKERFNRVKKIPYSINPDYGSYSNTNRENGKTTIEYNANDAAIHPETNTLHEFAHATTNGNLRMSNKAKELYKNAFITEEQYEKVKTSDIGKTVFTSEMDYYKLETEMDARKKILESDMEKLGVKKYNQPMTHEHYQKLLELMKEGKLDHNSVQILLITTEESLIEILNTVAKNDTHSLEPNLS